MRNLASPIRSSDLPSATTFATGVKTVARAVQEFLTQATFTQTHIKNCTLILRGWGFRAPAFLRLVFRLQGREIGQPRQCNPDVVIVNQSASPFDGSQSITKEKPIADKLCSKTNNADSG